MHKDQSNTAVQYSKDATVKRNQRDHKYLERNNHRCDHQGKQNTACFPFITNNYKRCHCRKHNCKDRRNGSNQKRVCKRCCKVHLFHSICEVGQDKSVRANQCQRICRDITFCLKRIENYHDKREDKCQKQNNQHCHCNKMADFFLLSCFFVFVHYAATSPFLPM